MNDADATTLTTRTTEIVDRLHSLLHDPQPGLFTWQVAVGKNIAELAKLAHPPVEHILLFADGSRLPIVLHKTGDAALVDKWAREQKG